MKDDISKAIEHGADSHNGVEISPLDVTQPPDLITSLRKIFRNAAKGHGRAGTADWPGGPYMSMGDAADVYAKLTQDDHDRIKAGEIKHHQV